LLLCEKYFDTGFATMLSRIVPKIKKPLALANGQAKWLFLKQLCEILEIQRRRKIHGIRKFCRISSAIFPIYGVTSQALTERQDYLGQNLS
jgi:hypothetical protein